MSGRGLAIVVAVVVLVGGLGYGGYRLFSELDRALMGEGCTAKAPAGEIQLEVEQAANAATIAGVAHREKLPRRALVIAYATAERLHRIGVLPAPASELRYLANPWVVGSQRLRAAGWEPGWTNEAALAAHLETAGDTPGRAVSRLQRKDATRAAAGAAVANDARPTTSPAPPMAPRWRSCPLVNMTLFLPSRRNPLQCRRPIRFTSCRVLALGNHVGEAYTSAIDRTRPAVNFGNAVRPNASERSPFCGSFPQSRGYANQSTAAV